ncbi:SulP family inorganic anion transporter [Staphylococcus schleiferi]|uniref:SulP family inorganic anion transporter n=1 Tax=Staphylococcus schleiferi TaxID=1295 RepID=UPI0014312FC8|nr:SulP family inorganic anion transporter [Staphylococcus schleiferi]MBF1993774.1 SulP family inorganic anion transporter [Staphylococcus schleiferi]MBF2039335.1 SulP family inorganic anion transporter [Staphylococcus schleiferi]MBF2101334.1 SulP family inorganic anion transporter [Staphylococcus schleiferi]MBF2103495.1 SulP family inorganic anion transporter [Staphylococcus schleiferi]MBF2105631.1 SulP family inorganic anion transporter [Staphylococcus schleiferi]
MRGDVVAYLNSWRGNVVQNISAGMLVALAMVPGAIAFSFIAGVSPTIGLLSSALMMMLISFLGARRLMVSAPSSGVSIVAVLINDRYGVAMLIAAMIVMGLFQILFAFCHVEKMIHKIPVLVVIGFMNALGYLLLTSQLKYVVGQSALTYIIALGSLCMLFWLPHVTERVPAALVTILFFSLIAGCFNLDLKYVKDLAQLHFEMPTIGFPDVPLQWMTLFEVALFGLMLAVVATIQTSLTVQMMDNLTDSQSSINKESFGQGLTNAIVGLLGGIGGSALVGQSKYNYQLGATSRLSTFMTGVMLLLFLMFLGPIVGRIPLVVLAIVLMRIAMGTFEKQTLDYIRERRWIEFGIICITFLLIIGTHQLALGVLIGTLIFYLVKRFKNDRKGRGNDAS